MQINTHPLHFNDPIAGSIHGDGLASTANESTALKTKKFAVFALLGVIATGVVCVAACAGVGLGVAGVIMATVGISAVLALPIGAAAGVVAGIALAALVVLLVRSFLNREVPVKVLNDYYKKVEKNLIEHNELFPDKPVPKYGEMSRNAGFVTEHAEESLKYKMELLAQAEQSIELSPNYFGGETMDRALEIIKERLRAKPHLQVHIILNPEYLTANPLIKELQEKYPNNFHWMVTSPKLEISSEIRQRGNHNKLLIVDGKYFVMGGTSMADKLCTTGDKEQKEIPAQEFIPKFFLGNGCRDHDIVGSGPMARTMRFAFFELFATWEYKQNNGLKEMRNRYCHLNPHFGEAVIASIDTNDKLVKDADMKFVWNNPESPLSNPCTDAIVATLKNANEGETIDIGNLYFNPTTTMEDAIIDAVVERNVKIRVLTNSFGKRRPNGPYLYGPSNLVHMNKILKKIGQNHQGKIDFYKYDVDNIVYHTKMMRAGNSGNIGSYNLSDKSDKDDFESLVCFDNDRLAAQIQGVMDRDLAMSKQIKVETVAKKTNRKITKVMHPLWMSLFGRMG